jgi:hypothetical protein
LIVNERLFEALMVVPKKFRNPYLFSLPYVWYDMRLLRMN